MRAAVIAGATGLVGRDCTRWLAGAYDDVVALVRRPAGLPVRERLLDFDQLGTMDLPQGADVFCALGTTIAVAGSKDAFRRIDLKYPLALAERALACGATQFIVVSSVGAHNPRSNFYLQVKREMEDRISRLPFKAVHILRPSILVGHRAERRLGESIAIPAARALGFLLLGGLSRYKAIEASDVAAAMVAAAFRGSRGVHVYEYEEITGLSAEAHQRWPQR